MSWGAVILIFLGVSACFGFVLVSGAPYVPTLKKQIDTALDLADLSPGMTIIELGCGDGRVLIAAAKRGLKAVGFELNPILFVVAWIRTLPHKKQVKLVFGDFWHQQWPKADAIYVFLLPRLMDKLEQKIRQEKLGKIKVLSFAFRFSKLEPQTERNGVLLYVLDD